MILSDYLAQSSIHETQNKFKRNEEVSSKNIREVLKYCLYPSKFWSYYSSELYTEVSPLEELKKKKKVWTVLGSVKK